MKRSPILMAAVVAVGHLVFLGTILLGRAEILRHGREITMPVEPVDPRDLLRGDYVQLAYPISRIPATIVRGWPSEGSTFGDVTVRVRVPKDGPVQAIAVFIGQAPDTPAADQIDLAGQSSTTPTQRDGEIAVTYGIERYYVPEGDGLAIEQDLRKRPFNVRLAVAPDGHMQIKALYDGDRRLYDEPLY